jgi:hypothetical protein
MPPHGFCRNLFALATCWALALPAWTQTPVVAPSGAIWSPGESFSFAKKAAKTRQSLSGIACAANAQNKTICLAAFDEGAAVQFAELLPQGQGSIQPSGVSLQLGRAKDELDAEGAATDGRYFYVTGSHAVKRSDCAANPASRHVLRIARDPVTGLAASTSALQDSSRLASLIASLRALRQSLDSSACLGTGGLDVEALAVRRGRLWFGLRGPTGPDTAFIVSVDADAFFGGADAKAHAHTVKLGPGRGLRDMVAVRDGILLLAGPDDDPRHAGVPWMLLHWDDAAASPAPKPLATLDLSGVALRKCDKEIKPEALTVLDESATGYRLLVLSDGLCDGGPLVFDVRR